MQSSRDSSVWKSLAVAFGNGLAFGVGMKLTQGAARHPETAPQPELAPVADRLGQIEQRIARIEQMPAAPPPVPAAPFDRKVLESVVKAVDERIKEHAGQVERCIAELETKVALESKSLSEQDEAVISAVEEVQAWCDTRIAAIRNDVDEEIGALREQPRGLPADLGQIVEERVAAQLRLLESQLREDVRQLVGGALASGPALDGGLAEMRAELVARNSEIVQLRRQIAESSSASRDLLMAIGQACRDAAERVTPPALHAPADEPECTVSAKIPAPESAAKAGEPTPIGLPIKPDPLAELPAPAFTEIGKPSHAWRIPLVSSFLLATAGLVLIRFL
jgi:hypothetical protein